MVVADIPGIERVGRLKYDDFRLLVSHSAMFDAPRHDEDFSLVQRHTAVPELHPHASLPDEKQLVLIVMMMPDEFPLELHELDLLAVEACHDLRAPMLGETGEFVVEIDRCNRGHGARNGIG